MSRWERCLVVIVAGVGALAWAAPAWAGNFTVDNNADPDGTPGTGCAVLGGNDCSLRDAITAANASVGVSDVINFGIAGGSIINVGNPALPAITDRVTIFGGSTPNIEINGPGTNTGTSGFELESTAGNSTIQGFAIGDFETGIRLDGVDNAQISGNRIGLNLAGNGGVGSPLPNGDTSNDSAVVLVNSADDNSIGALGGNTISANTGAAVTAFAGSDNTTITDNRIGTDIQSNPLGNQSGIDLSGADGATITNNVIVDHPGTAITLISGATATIRGNLVGTTGTAALGNGVGIALVANPSATIGGPNPSDGNTIVASDLDGIRLDGSAPSVVQNNHIGVDSAGNTEIFGGGSLANAGNGILINNSAGNQIGTAGAGNEVSNNVGRGIHVTGLTSTGNTILANTVGASGAGNHLAGIRVAAPSNVIGSPGAGNLVAANGDAGISVSGADSDANVVQGNLVGVNATGTAPRGNGDDGISVSGADSATVGGLGAGEGNLVSANEQTGIDIENGSDDSVVLGNLAGTNAAGTLGFPNERGIRIEGDRVRVEGNAVAGNVELGIFADQGGDVQILGNLIGRSFSGATIPNGGPGLELGMDDGPMTAGGPGGAANTITGNLGPGILVSDAAAIATIADNSIFANGGLGIDLEPDGVTPNDPFDADVGPNVLQNFPDISSAQFAGGQTTVAGTINSTPNTELTLRFFASGACDPSGFGEGQRSLGQATVTTNGNGDASFSAVVGDTSAGEQVSATASGPSGTSEFSACRAAETRPPDPDPDPPPALCRKKTATIEGTDASETIRGTSGKDVIAAGAGNDRVRGLGGNDVICGEGSNDNLAGGGGRDVLDGGDGRDVLNGGSGKGDLCIGGKAKDRAANSCERARSA